MAKGKIFPFGILRKVGRAVFGRSHPRVLQPVGKAARWGSEAARKKGRFAPSKRWVSRVGGPKVKNDSTGNQRMASAHGKKPVKLSSRIRDAIEHVVNPINHEVIQNSGQVKELTRGGGNYAVFELNDSQDITDLITKMGSTVGDVVKRSAKLHLRDSSMEVNITNQSNTTSIMRVYEYICRRDVPATLDQGGGAGTIAADTEWIVDNGFNFFSTGASRPTAFAYSTTLYQNPLFCTYFKILKVRDIELAPGKNLTLNLEHRQPKDINCILNDAADMSAAGRFTRGFVVQARSAMVQTIVSTVAAQESGMIQYAYTLVKRYHWSQSFDGSSLTNITDNMTRHTVGSAVTGTQMNQLTGAVSNEILV